LTLIGYTQVCRSSNCSTKTSLTTKTESDINPLPQGPYANPFQAYTASKIFAHHATDSWYADASPSFSLIRILPSFVVGKNELVTSKSAFLSGSNAVVFSPLVGDKISDPTPGATVHLDDVANAHVQSLNLRIDGNQNFLLSSDAPAGIVFDDIIEIAKQNFPEAVKSSVLPLGGSRPTARINLDVSKAEKAFGWRHKPFEEQFKPIIEQWIELSASA
jgi:nucleoside-diphosphate-sugar epimerase